MNDIEATLRAQLDAQRILIERFESALRGKESENAELRARLDEANFERSTLRGGCDSLANQLVAARAEASKHVKSCAEWMHRAVALEHAEHKWETLAESRAEVARLTAEVERLKGREREAERILSDSLNDHDCVACGADTRRKRVPYGHESTCAVSAWLAGCKS